MKYLITESQLDKAIFRYLNNQNFIQIEKNNRIYFANSENDDYSQITYDKNDKWFSNNRNLVKEISSFFSLQLSDSKQVVGRWVENTLKMRVTNAKQRYMEKDGTVSDTLQMKPTGPLIIGKRSNYLF